MVCSTWCICCRLTFFVSRFQNWVPFMKKTSNDWNRDWTREGWLQKKKLRNREKKFWGWRRRRWLLSQTRKSFSIPDFLCLFVAALSHFFSIGSTWLWCPLLVDFCKFSESSSLTKAVGSSCGSDGRAVNSDTRDPHFKSQHRQNFIYQLYI